MQYVLYIVPTFYMPTAQRPFVREKLILCGEEEEMFLFIDA